MTNTVVRYHLIASLRGEKYTGPTGDLRSLPLADFRASLRHVETTKKHSVGSYCPADFSADNNGKRGKDFVTGASNSCWLDIDKMSEEAWEKVLGVLSRFEAEAWTTYSYVPGSGSISARVRVTVDRPHVSAQEVRAAREGLARELTAVVYPGRETGPRSALIADAACYQPAAVFYLPAVDPTRAGTGRVWAFDGPVRPAVDDLVDLAEVSAREAARARLLASGDIVARDASEPATEADRAYAAEWFTRQVEIVCAREDVNHRKNKLFALGGRLRETAETGGLDLTACLRTVRDSLLSNRPQDCDILFPHLESGLQRSTELGPVRSEDRQIDEVAAEIVQETLETRTRVGIERLLATGATSEGTLDAAREGLASALRAASAFVPANKRRLRVIHADAGLGKTTGVAQECAKNVRNDIPTAFLVPNHDVALEFLRKLPDDVREETVHLHSPLREVPGVPTCPLPPAELAAARSKVFDFGAQQYDVCGGCRLASTCSAKATWESRNRRAKNAKLVVVYYDNFEAADGDEHRPRVLIVDEQPPVVVTAEATPADFAAASGLPVDTMAACFSDLRAGRTPGDVPTYVPTVSATVSGPVERAERAAATLRRVATVARLPGGRLTLHPDGKVEASAPSALLARLRDRSGVILSATPATDVLGDAEVVRLGVAKHPLHIRVVFPLRESGRRDLTQRSVETAGQRVAREAGEGRGLLITFKAWADKCRDGTVAVPPNVDVAHYGAVRGRNAWEKHTAVICVGTPWDRHLSAARSIPGTDEWEYARRRASDELRQAVERVRSVGRPDERVWMGVLAALPPTGWGAEASVEDWGSTPNDGLATLRAVLEGGVSQAHVARHLGVDRSNLGAWVRGERSIPSKYLAPLTALKERVEGR